MKKTAAIARISLYDFPFVEKPQGSSMGQDLVPAGRKGIILLHGRIQSLGRQNRNLADYAISIGSRFLSSQIMLLQ